MRQKRQKPQPISLQRQACLDLLQDDGELCFLEPAYHDEAIVGLLEMYGPAGSIGPVVCYDRDRVIRLLISHEEMTEEDALEWYTVNTTGGYVGPLTPAFLQRI